MFNVIARVTYKNVPAWHSDLCRVCENIPIVLCGDKVDVKNKQMKAKHVTSHRNKNLQYYEISAKATTTLRNPSDVHRDVNLHFVESSTLAPPEVHIDIMAQQAVSAFQLYKAELTQASALPLPADDNDEAFES
ncbi:unnamed protein product [Sphagnum jensenii]